MICVRLSLIAAAEEDLTPVLPRQKNIENFIKKLIKITENCVSNIII
jgi:hypothetical protein